MGSQSSFEEFLTLRGYGRVMARSDTPSFLLRWSEDSQKVHWGNSSKLNMDQFRLLLRSLWCSTRSCHRSVSNVKKATKMWRVVCGCAGRQAVRLSLARQLRVEFLEIGLDQVVFVHPNKVVATILGWDEATFPFKGPIVLLPDELNCKRRSNTIKVGLHFVAERRLSRKGSPRQE